MAEPRLLVCSNRGPFAFEGSVRAPVARRGGGGLIGSIAPLLEGSGGTWIAAPLTDTDRALAKRGDPIEQNGFTLRLLDIPADVQSMHYDVVSNEVLWFLFHYLFDPSHAPTFDRGFRAAWDAYRSVNEAFAQAISQTRADAVLVEDYHLMLAASCVRAQTKKPRPLLYFHHTPWCEPDYFSLLPGAVRQEILEGMLAFDVVGFHASRWVSAFVRCCDRFLKGVRIDGDRIRWGRRTTRVLAAPVPIDEAGLRAAAGDPATRSWIESHDELREGRKLLLRVDRIDLSKNPLRGFLAFEQLLERRPDLANDVLFMAMLYPSRLSVERYQTYYSECLGVVRRVNERFARKLKAQVGPIHVIFEDDFHRSLGAMQLYDALLVNPVFDGLNLVAKEGAVLNERSGSLILSSNAGVHEELAGACLSINPFDVPATAEAMEQALELPEQQRVKQARKLRRLATRSSPAEWLRARLDAAGAQNL